MPRVGYIAYVDEAGDDGLRRIRSPGWSGASEWLVLSAVVVRVEREAEVEEWVRDIIRNLAQHQLSQLHFRNLSCRKKEEVCRQLSSKHLRLFVFISHKRNMQNYRNLNAERARVNPTAWFYAWCTRLLMESVADFCGRRSRREHGEPRIVRLELSQRGGLNLKDIQNYYTYIKRQAGMGLSFRKEFPLDWAVIDPHEIKIRQNWESPGLQLADVLASAFFAGLERDAKGNVQPKFAKLLMPRMCPNRWGKRYMYSIKVLPRYTAVRLPAAQRELLTYYSRH